VGSRFETGLQTVLIVGTAMIAFGGSLGHAVQLAVDHGQNVYYASATAVLVETTALSATLELRRRRRAGQPTWFPILVLIAGAALSLAVQIACAQRSVWGWILAAIPVVSFLVLMKFVLARHGHTPTAGH
jgi:peptidoglycan/LPS O-acetylase OafA/YrhL